MNKIIYLDAAASWQKAQSVINAEMDFLAYDYANAGRGICARATAVDDMVQNARDTVANFIGADAGQVVFTSGATDGLNRVLNLARQMLPDDCRRPTVCVSDLDHHSARLPWENLARNAGCDIVVAPLDSDFNIDMVKIPAADIMIITAMSNVIGVPQDVAEIIRVAHTKNPNVITVVDAAQYIAHCPINVKSWGCDFLCFSGHKIGADTGVGIMYVRSADNLMPDKFGGGMVLRIDGDNIIPNAAPERFEAGTLPLTQIVGLRCAIKELQSMRPDTELTKAVYDGLKRLPRIKILTPRNAAVVTFVVDGMHVLDFGALVGAYGICVRVGNMCATWVQRALGVDGTVRVSVGPWNTTKDVNMLIDVIKKIVK